MDWTCPSQVMFSVARGSQAVARKEVCLPVRTGGRSSAYVMTRAK